MQKGETPNNHWYRENTFNEKNFWRECYTHQAAQTSYLSFHNFVSVFSHVLVYTNPSIEKGAILPITTLSLYLFFFNAVCFL